MIAIPRGRVRQKQCVNLHDCTLPLGADQPTMQERDAFSLIAGDNALKLCRILLVHGRSLHEQFDGTRIIPRQIYLQKILKAFFPTKLTKEANNYRFI